MNRKRLLFLMATSAFVVSLFISVLIPGCKSSEKTKGKADRWLAQPSAQPQEVFEEILYTWLRNRDYAKLGWKVDKRVRDCGPYVHGTYYGVHPAVRIFYSPEVITWLENGREGEIPDGAVIVKEMYSPPAARWAGFDSLQLDSAVNNWTVMIKDSEGSYDGWYWSGYSYDRANNEPLVVDSLSKYPYNVPNSGFGLYCSRCHASANDEHTFSSLDNIKGYEGDPLVYHVDNSWMPQYQEQKESQPLNTEISEHSLLLSKYDFFGRRLQKPFAGVDSLGHVLNESFYDQYPEMSPVLLDSVVGLPPVTYDHIVAAAGGPEQFITSDQCMPCHSGQTGWYYEGPNMFIPESKTDSKVGMNVSPYGEWNWSMMGLAGRDPIFFAQLESELKLHPTQTDTIQNTCFRCHGVMGQRQVTIDEGGRFYEPYVYEYGDDPNAKYGALARDGISCMVCHQIVDDDLPLDSIMTGQFKVSPPGNVHGPFSDPSTHAMHTTLGVTPRYSTFIKESRLCGSCHTVYLPVFDDSGNIVDHFYEQTTYIEWQNSSYQNEFPPVAGIPQLDKSCQDCHMPGTFPYLTEKDSLAFRIANVQNQLYPQAEHLAPYDSIEINIRDSFRRHTLLGINQWGLEFFDQFDSILGVRKKDYMTGTSDGLPHAIRAGNLLAKTHTADVKIKNVVVTGGLINAEVEVKNLTGHRFPSGVGFRRAFLAFEVLDSQGRIVWASGQTNNNGVIVGSNGLPLPTEFFLPVDGKQSYEPHYKVIDRQDQVQIYQELVVNTDGLFTTSFLSLDSVVKDNRLLPLGWTPNGPEGFDHSAETKPHGGAASDSVFVNGTGSDRITYIARVPSTVARTGTLRATLYYQAIPPFYLKDRFSQAQGRNGQRLYYMSSHLQTSGTNIENWKLATGSDSYSLR